jgi:hypothetical protein
LNRVGEEKCFKMKKIVIFSLTFMLLSFVSTGQTKTAIGLTEAEIAALENSNPDYKINLSNLSADVQQYFVTVDDAQKYLDSLRNMLKSKTLVTELQVQVSSPAGKFAPCGCGNYSISNIGSAGLFSNFTFTFDYCNGSVSNGNIGANGIQIGWTLGSTTGSYSGLYGCSTVTATFGTGIFSWTQTVRFRFHFNPNTCSLYFTPVTNGNCSTPIGL